MRKFILPDLLFPFLLSCSTQPEKKIKKQNITEMEKESIESSLALSPKPMKEVGVEGEVIGKCLNHDKGTSMCSKEPMASDGIVRLSKIEVFPQFLDEYMGFVTEVGEISLRTEPGVLTMYAVQEKKNPCNITILETYSSQAAYVKHIASEHFQKYKQGTLHMVKSLVLSDQKPLNPANKINNFIQ